MSTFWQWATKRSISFVELIFILIAVSLLNILHSWWLQDVIAIGFAAIAWASVMISQHVARRHKNGAAA